MDIDSLDLLVQESAKTRQGDVLAAFLDNLINNILSDSYDNLCVYVRLTIQKTILRQLSRKITHRIDGGDLLRGEYGTFVERRHHVTQQLDVIERQCNLLRGEFSPALLKEKHQIVQRNYRKFWQTYRV